MGQRYTLLWWHFPPSTSNAYSNVVAGVKCDTCAPLYRTETIFRLFEDGDNHMHFITGKSYSIHRKNVAKTTPHSTMGDCGPTQAYATPMYSIASQLN